MMPGTLRWPLLASAGACVAPGFAPPAPLLLRRWRAGPGALSASSGSACAGGPPAAGSSACLIWLLYEATLGRPHFKIWCGVEKLSAQWVL